MKSLLAGFLLLSFLSHAHSANSDFIDNGNYTTDTLSGLDWLDLTETQNQSYDYVSSQFGVGGLYEGWQYATGTQFLTMVNNWTDTTASTNLSTTNIYTEGTDSIDGLVQLLGNTYYPNTTNDPNGIMYSYGIIDDVYPTNPSLRYVALLQDNNEDIEFNWDTARANQALINNDAQLGQIGSYLVRTTVPAATSVPEVNAIVLFAFGLLSIFGAARRKV